MLHRQYLSDFKHLGYQPHSVGHLSQSLQQYGQALPATVSMASQTVVFYLSDEIFAIPTPILVTIEPAPLFSTSSGRPTARPQTWKTHFETLKDHHFHSLGMASDRGLGLVAGYRDASLKLSGWQTTFMSFKAASMYVSVGEKRHSAIAKEDRAIRKFHRQKRVQPQQALDPVRTSAPSL